MHVPIFAYLVFQKAAIVLLYVLWQVGVEHKRGYLRVGQLRAILNFDVLAFGGWRRISLDKGEHHFIKFRRSHACLAVKIHLFGRFKHLEDALLGKCRGENDGEIHKGSHAFANGILESLYHLLVFIWHQVPLVNHHNKRLLVFLNKLEDVHVLRFDAARGINHQNTNVAMLDSTYRTHYAIKLQIFGYLVFSAYSGRIYKVEVETKLIETRINTVACGTCNLGNDVAVFAYKGVDDAAFACIRPTHHSKTRYAIFNIFVFAWF